MKTMENFEILNIFNRSARYNWEVALPSHKAIKYTIIQKEVRANNGICSPARKVITFVALDEGTII